MADLFTSGRLVDFILVLVLFEVILIAGYWRLTGRGVALADLLPNVMAGVFLMLALRTSLSGGGWMIVSGCLGCAGLAHVIDIGRRWKN